MITRFSALYVGQIELDNVGLRGTPADERRYSNERLVDYTIPPPVEYRGYQLEKITVVPRPIHLPVELWQPVASGKTLPYIAQRGIKAMVARPRAFPLSATPWRSAPGSAGRPGTSSSRSATSRAAIRALST